MAICRATMIFRVPTADARVGGFSESWYKEGTPADVMRSLMALCLFRAGALPTASKISGQRVQELGSRAITDSEPFPGVIRSTTDVPQMAAQCSVTDAAGLKKKIFMCRGINDDSVESGALVRGGATSIQLGLFMNNLAVNGFQFRSRDTTLPAIKIVSVDANGVFALTGDLAFAVGDFLTAVRVRSQQGRSIVGSFYVSNRVDAQHGTLFGWPTGQTVSLSGSFRKQAFVYPSVAAGTGKVSKVAVRKVGRPSDLYRGRATRRR